MLIIQVKGKLGGYKKYVNSILCQDIDVAFKSSFNRDYEGIFLTQLFQTALPDAAQKYIKRSEKFIKNIFLFEATRDMFS